MSKPLKFTVGTNCEEVFIHEEVLKSRSTPWFDANSGKFAGDEPLVIKDADRHIFSLVCQYLYTGDYSIALPSDDPPPGLTSGGPEKPEQERASVLEGNLFRDSGSVHLFANYIVRHIQPRPSEGSQCSYNPAEDYTEALLTHARLHVFAARYELQELRDICLFKLLHLLHAVPLYKDRIGDIVRLFNFVLGTDAGLCENIITMLRHYVIRHLGLFLRNKGFQILLREQPSLAVLLLDTLGNGLYLGLC